MRSARQKNIAPDLLDAGISEYQDLNNTAPQSQHGRLARFIPTYRLRTLLLLFFAACVMAGWISGYGARDRLATLELAKQDGHVIYDYDPSNSWRSSPRLTSLLRGTDFGEGVVWGVHQIGFSPTARVTDDGLKHISEFPETSILCLGEANITDDGMVHLARMRELRSLHLFKTGISDSGLEHLSALTNLEFLALDNTAVSDRGLAHLRPLRNLQTLSLENTVVTDEGLRHIHGLLQLQYVILTGTNVTSVGIDQLRTALPNCQIDFNGQTFTNVPQ